jgi:hypothetical protein
MCKTCSAGAYEPVAVSCYHICSFLTTHTSSIPADLLTVLSAEAESIKKKQKILELKNTKTALNNSVEGLNSRVDQTGETNWPTQRYSFKII